jgi:hypothetical protein
MDASETGGDVFFRTLARLSPQDYDTAYDVYDAHECSGGVPCFPAVVSTPSCQTEASCRAAPAPQPALYGAPASATFSGAGNVSPPVSQIVPKKIAKKTVKCKKGFVKDKKGKCVKKQKNSKKKAVKAKRAHSERRASR